MQRVLAVFSLTLMSIAGNAQDLVITNARIITGTGAVVDSGSVVVADGQIVSFSEGAAAADPDVVTIDAGGRTVMPGFIDGHRHVIRGEPVSWLAEQAEQRMQEYLEAGFTTIQSCGDSLDEILELRRRLDSGELNGPRLIVSGRVPLARSSGPRPDVDPARIDISRPPHRPTEAAAAIPEGETRAAVQSLAEAGVDAIKTVIIITPEGPETGTLSVVADESAQVGVRSITHAVTVVDTMAAVEAGTHVLVHTPHIGQMTEEQARIVAESGIPMVSTLGIFVPTFADDNVLIRDRTGHDNLPRFRDLDPFPFETLSSAGQGPVNARLLWDAGVTYGYGTDTVFLPRDALAHELRPLRLVFSREDIVAIMTRHAAAGVSRSDLGTIEAGKTADLVILGGDPLADIDALLDVEVVIKGGRVVVDKR